MAILDVLIAPDPRLKQKSLPIEHIDDEIRALARDMLATMYQEQGIGLAAVQVGIHKRLLVADIEWRKDGEPGEQWVIVNPEILEDSDEMNVYKEGCLSFPDQFGDVKRPKKIRLRYQTLDGETKEQEFDGLLATCIQHEIDHLNGITFVDHLSMLKRDMILRKLTKLKKAGAFDHHHEHDHVHGEHCNHG